MKDWQNPPRTGRSDLVVRGAEFGFTAARRVLGPVDLVIESASRVALVGPSGSGKSTLLQLMSGVLQPTAGSVEFGGAALSGLRQDERARIRLEQFGLVFQFAELVPELSLFENVELPLRILRRKVERDRILALLARIGIAHVADHLPSQVSGGERQRAAIARAVVHQPAVILADEPTGALDQDNGREVLSLLIECSKEAESSLVVVTHDHEVARRLDKIVTLRDGQLAA